MIGLIFFSAVLLISFAGRQLNIGLLQIVATVCLIYGLSEYVLNAAPGMIPIYLLLILADLAMITSSVFRR